MFILGFWGAAGGVLGGGKPQPKEERIPLIFWGSGSSTPGGGEAQPKDERIPLI